MNSKIHFFHIKILVLITLLIVLVLQKASAQEAPVKIAITPFTLNAPQDLQYLKSGIQDMLESRLSQDENVVVISDEKTALAMQGMQEPIDENEARAIGRQLDADFVLIGSLTVFGASSSLDARLVDVAKQKSTLSFFEQSDSIDDLVPKINAFAADINATVTSPAAAAAAAPAPDPAAIENGVQAHPEKMAEDPMQADTAGAKDDQGFDHTPLLPDFWKSRIYKIRFDGLALGDVDGDGNIETVVVSADKMIIFRNEKQKLFKINEIKWGGYRAVVGVDVGDINGNGIDEIFVSALNDMKTAVASDVYEFDGHTFKQTVKKSRQLYRVVGNPKQAPMLLGQEFKPKRNHGNPVHLLQWDGADYSPGDTVLPAKSEKITLPGVAYGDVMNSSNNIPVFYTTYNRIQVVDADSETVFTSSEHYGGSTLTYSMGKQNRDDDDAKRYFQMRLVIADVNGDGKNEILAIKNYDKFRETLALTKWFDGFHIESLTWDGLGLATYLQTPKKPGSIRDFALFHIV